MRFWFGKKPEQSPNAAKEPVVPAPPAIAGARPTPPAAPTAARRNTIKAPPAARGSGKIYQLKIIERIDELSYREVLTRPGGALEVPADQHDRLAVIALSGKQIALVFTNTSHDSIPASRVLNKASQLGYELAETYEATGDVVHLLYDTGGINQTREVEYRGEMDTLFDEIAAQAVEFNASDIHLQVTKSNAEVKYRIDGDLRHMRVLRRDTAVLLSNAIFNFCEEDSRIGQGASFDSGRFQDARLERTLNVHGRGVVKVNMRFASMKVTGGWDIVLRILMSEVDTKIRSLEELGYDTVLTKAIDRGLSRPTGLLLVVGSTGSGKSTTIQTLLDMLYRRYGGRRLIRTIEDPPEYHIPGARQTPAKKLTKEEREAGTNENGFVAALKAAMRGDPDILLIGEVRDIETAKNLQQAVQTGHKVLATLHAANPFEAIERCIDLGIHRNVLASDGFISGIIYQKLLPLVCPDCSAPIDEVHNELGPDLFKRINSTPGLKITDLRFRGDGCKTCRGSGIKGRTVVAEILVPDRLALQYIRSEDALSLSAYWRSGLIRGDVEANGRTAMDHALEKMQMGLISPIDTEDAMGYLGDQESREQARSWYDESRPPLRAHHRVP